MIRVQNGEQKVVMNIVRDILSIKHFIFSEQIVLMNGFSIVPKTNWIVLTVTIQVVKTIQVLK